MLKDLFEQQRSFLNHFFDRIDIEDAQTLLQHLIRMKGSLLFTGIGKSGQIAKKLVSTFLSQGTKSAFLHPVEALHGDLGMVTKNDIVIFLSKSGNSKELIDLAQILKQREIFCVLWVCKELSPLSRLVDHVCLLPLVKELCTFNLSPTTSPTLQLCYGDTISVALMQMKRLSIEAYAQNHPAGFIGIRSKKIDQVMIPFNQLPIVHFKTSLNDVLVEMSQKRLGCVLATDDLNKLVGIFTTGDLNRALLSRKKNILHTCIDELMTKDFSWICIEERVDSALNLMQNPDKRIQVLPVMEKGSLVGLLHLHDIVGNAFDTKVDMCI